jgi:PAS domain S-box-containing protein
LAAISWDRQFRCSQWNKAAEKIFGYSRDEALGRHALGLIVPSTIEEEIGDTFQSLLDQKGGTRKVNENITKDGRTIICGWYNTPITDETGEAVGVASLAEDITEQKRAQDEITFKSTLLTTQQEASGDGILSVDADGNVISISQRFIDLWDIPPEVVESNSDERLLESVLDKLVDPALFIERVRELYKHKHETSVDDVKLKDGRTFERHSAPMLGADDRYYGRVWMYRDITSRKQSEDLIWNQANFDPRTKLANRQMLRDRLEQEIRNAHRTGSRVALLYLDLDRFKDVNDTLGPSLGDMLLKEAAARPSASVREADTVARLGGDEFTIVMGG